MNFCVASEMAALKNSNTNHPFDNTTMDRDHLELKLTIRAPKSGAGAI